MPAPRLSLSAEAARAAALQAAFNEKRWVWVPDEKEGYLAGWVNREEEDFGDIVMDAGGEIRRIPLYALSKMNPPKFDRVDDIADLTYLNEASVVHNLRLRYGSGAIYTYSGLFLVAINPYQALPLYSDAIVRQYRNTRRDENAPHIFAVAERAWVNMGEERENQSILITGESGAGKTESTKKVIQYLAAIATDVHHPLPAHSTMPTNGLPRSGSLHRLQSSISATSANSLTAKGRLGLLERQILQANPILESFGNAQTQRNNNSSRFGKFVRISFAPDGSIAGANIDWYLLEKSRVVVRSEAERSFHVFYQLMVGGGALKDALLLSGGVEDYSYLNISRREVDGVDDREEWKVLQSALDVVGFTPAEQFDLFRIVAAILHIGNITITSTRADDAAMPDPSQAERVCQLLGISASDFSKAVLRPRVLAGREWVSQARTRQQALDELSALCKTLYEKSFGQLVDRVNRALDRPSSKSSFIGVLDIAGFEIFETNAYEQLLINYTNEKLQQFFNHHMFVLEQEEYAREGIEWDYVNFGLDLQPTIDLIETSGAAIGILSCLDEECIMPKATDFTFTHKLNHMWAGELLPGEQSHPGRNKYEPSRFEQGFIVQHYAGKVEYRTDGWLEKNKDPLNDNVTRVLAASSERYVSSLFADYADPVSHVSSAISSLTLGKKRGIKKGAFRTVGQRHKEQLSSLMAQLQATQPHFVRCIVPNNLKKPGRVDVPLILDQLRCNGVLEGIRIARLGYPNRLPFVEFRQRYEVLTPGIIPRGYMDGRKACLRMVDALELDKSIYRVGTAKIFLKAGVLAELEERRDALLYSIFTKLQAGARMWTARRQMKKILNRAIAIRTIQRNARVYGELRDWPWWQLYTKVRPLLAATRNDEELRRKDAELQLTRERAEWEKQERASLEKLKMSLEADKKKVEEALEGERALAVDKDGLLERSKMREAELEEDVAALQSDLDIIDSQLDRALKIQKEGEEKNETLRLAFDQAADHLVRLEKEQEEWVGREAELTELVAAAQHEMEALRADKAELQQVSEDLKDLVTQREEDLARARERMESYIADLEIRLGSETRDRDTMKDKSANLEEDARLAKEQLAEMARTATQYSTIIQKKEEEAARLVSDLVSLKREREQSFKQMTGLQADITTLKSELNAQQNERERGREARGKLQEEVDELRALMDAKTSEDTRRSEVEKSKEQELADLRGQVARLNAEVNDERRLGLEGQSKLKVELDNSLRTHKSLLDSHRSLVDREKSTQSRLVKVEGNLAEAEKVKRTLESDLHSIRSRQTDTDGQLAEAIRAKEGFERQLLHAQTKCQDFEDSMLQMERDKTTHDRQLGTIKKQLEAEATKRAQLEQLASRQKAELVQLRDKTAKYDRELNKVLTDLKHREWDVKQLESKQDKTIVEHVHVLEEAKRVTDRQLADAQKDLKEKATYIRSLEKMKHSLASEAEDMARERAQEHMEMLAREKAARSARYSVDSSVLASSIQSEMREALESHKRKAETFMAKFEASEAARSKASRAEAYVRQSLADAEKAQAAAVAEKEAANQRAQVLEKRSKDLQAKLDAEGRETSDLDMLRQQLSAELEEERKQHLKDLADRDFTADQTRKKYQAELAALSEELQSQRDAMTRLRDDSRKLRSDYEELQLRFDDEVYNGGAWKKEKERLDTKVEDLTKAYESATHAQTDQQSQIVALHSQVRELRGVLTDAESERALLQKARRSLQQELDGIKLDTVDAQKMTSDQEFQRMRLQKQDLERSLEEQSDRVGMAFERMKKAEAHANDCQVDLEKVRMENSHLDRLNAQLGKQLQDLNVRIVDFETKSYGTPPRSNPNTKRFEVRIEELTHQLAQASSEHGESSRLHRLADKIARDAQFQLADSERQRERLEEERKLHESQIQGLRQTMDAMQTEDSNLQLVKRRAERDAAESKQKTLNLEREVERLRNRLDRSSSSFMSPTSSPRSKA